MYISMVHNLTTIFFSFELITERIFIFEHHCFFFPSFSEYHGFCRKLLSICHGLARMLIARLKWSNKRTQPIPVHSEKSIKELGRMKKLWKKGRYLLKCKNLFFSWYVVPKNTADQDACFVSNVWWFLFYLDWSGSILQFRQNIIKIGSNRATYFQS